MDLINNNEEGFRRYIQNVVHRAESTALKYARAIAKASDFLREDGAIVGELYAVENLAELGALRDRLFAIPAFQDLDTRGNRMYSCGVNWYCEFRAWLVNND